MKNTFKKLITAIAIMAALVPLRASGAVTVYADETQTNDAVMTSVVPPETNAPAATNAPATKASRHKKSLSDADHAPVRIDATGIHVGGSDPVDINVPDFAHHGGSSVTGALAMLIPILAIVSPFVMIVAILAIIFYFRHRRLKMHHETLRAMIEKGMPIPPEMVADRRDNPQKGDAEVRVKRNDFRGGLILVAIGAALLMIAGKVGWILVFIGAARLVIWLVEDRNPKI